MRSAARMKNISIQIMSIIPAGATAINTPMQTAMAIKKTDMMSQYANFLAEMISDHSRL